MRLVFAGTPDVAVPALEALVASRHEVVAVLTRPDAPAGRGRAPKESPVAKRAAELGIDILKPASPSEPEFLKTLAELNPDCCPVVAYGAILRREALDIPEYGWVNLHFSVLPAWRGAAPVQRSIMAGDEVTGACVFSIVEELDAGPVLGLLTERILDTDTAGDLLERLAGFGAGLLKDAIDHIEDGDISAMPQAEDGLSYAPKLTVEDARVDWGRPAFAIDRQIRGCTPSPGAWTTLDPSRPLLADARGGTPGSGQAAQMKPLLLPEEFEGHPLRKEFVLASRVVKAWPGAKEPGESDAESTHSPSRRRMKPPGVPEPDEWGPDAAPVEQATEESDD